MRRRKRKPVREYLLRQGRFAHFTEEDIEYFQKKIDQMWEQWLIPGAICIKMSDDIKKAVAKSEAELASTN